MAILNTGIQPKHVGGVGSESFGYFSRLRRKQGLLNKVNFILSLHL